MADTVAYLMEKMVPELEDLERRHLFSRAEIRRIVKRRTDFEYLLKRQAAVKEDFLRYVDYETQLEAIRQERKKALIQQLKAVKLQWKASISDRSITRGIMFIFERATRKFKADLRLWLKYMECCKACNASRQMQKVLTRALQLHPTVPGLWMYAASWEFEHRLNMDAARSLMQRGLRMCPNSVDLWTEYFRLEVSYALKLKARREALGLSGKCKEDEEGGKKSLAKKVSGKNIEMMEDEETHEEEEEQEGACEQGEVEEGEGEREGHEEKEDEETCREERLCVRLCHVIFRNATSALPLSLPLRRKFLGALGGLGPTSRGQLETLILSDVARNFPRSCEACEMRAEWCIRNSGSTSSSSSSNNNGSPEPGHGLPHGWLKAKRVFASALHSSPSPHLFRAYALFLMRYAASPSLSGDQGAAGSGGLLPLAGNEPSHVARALAQDAVQELEEIVSSAQRHGMLTKELRDSLLLMLLRDGRTEEAGLLFGAPATVSSNGLTSKQGSGKTPQSPLAWLSSISNSDTESTTSSLLFTLHSEGLEAVRAQYTRNLPLLPPPSSALPPTSSSSSSFRQLCVQLECRALLSSCTKAAGAGSATDGMSRLISLFETVLSGREESQNSSLWLQYCQLHFMLGAPNKANEVFWRAKKVLDDPSGFLRCYQEMAR